MSERCLQNQDESQRKETRVTLMKSSESTYSVSGKKVVQAPEEVLSTLEKDGQRRWIYPTPSRGRYWFRRAVVGWVLIAVFVGLPLVPVGGKPAIFLDIAHSEFTFLGLTLYATETILLALALLIFLLGLMLATALLGRVWCGWGCPQTVYLEFVYRPIERLIEGRESVRKKRDKGPWTKDKIWRKSLKWFVFSAISLALAHTFVAYFVSWSVLLEWMQQPPTEHWGYFVMMGATTALILWDFGNFREQMCTIACPYARLQSVLMDRDSMIVSYDSGRGEQRGRRSREQRKQEEAGLRIELGDCIDCGACVRTCPTGIDIRNGLQMECIGCTQCIDACDSIMDSIAKPRGLIRYTSENQIEQKKSQVIRPRVLLYATLLVVVTVIFGLQIGTRGTLDIDVGRVVGEPFSVLETGEVTNRLRFRLQNRSSHEMTMTVHAISPENTRVTIVGQPQVRIAPGETARFQAWVVIPRDAFENGSIEGTFELRTAESTLDQVSFNLLGPSK